MPPKVLREVGREIEELLLAARVVARKEKDVPSLEAQYEANTSKFTVGVLGDTSGPLRIVIDFAEGADPEAVRSLAADLEGWTASKAFVYGARSPRVEASEGEL
jgi:hypothetical protein